MFTWLSRLKRKSFFGFFVSLMVLNESVGSKIQSWFLLKKHTLNIKCLNKLLLSLLLLLLLLLWTPWQWQSTQHRHATRGETKEVCHSKDVGNSQVIVNNQMIWKSRRMCERANVRNRFQHHKISYLISSLICSSLASGVSELLPQHPVKHDVAANKLPGSCPMNSSR